LAFTQKKIAELGTADAHSVFRHRLKHWRELALRRADDLEHVGGCGLPLKRFTQFAEQSCVFDGDNGLRGKIRKQFALPVGEGVRFGSVDCDCSNELIVLDHRNIEDCPKPAKIDCSYENRLVFDVSRLGCDIGDMNSLSGDGDTAQRRSWTR